MVFQDPWRLIRGSVEVRSSRLGCPVRTKFLSSDICFAAKLAFGLDNFNFFRNCPTSRSFTSMSSKMSCYIEGISDDAEMKDVKVGKS